MDFKFLSILKSPNQELLTILENNVIGTPGKGMLYQHSEVKLKMGKIANPFFVNLRKNDHILGLAVFAKGIQLTAASRIALFMCVTFRLKMCLEESK